MLNLKQLCNKHGITPQGVIQIGACPDELFTGYRDLGLKRILFIDANQMSCAAVQQKQSAFDGIRINLITSSVDGVDVLHIVPTSVGAPVKQNAVCYPNVMISHQVIVSSYSVDSLLEALNIESAKYNLLSIAVQCADVINVLQGAINTLPLIAGIDIKSTLEGDHAQYTHVCESDSFLVGLHFVCVSADIGTNHLPKDVFYVTNNIVTLSTIGINGRFANQIFQYAFARIAAERENLRLELPKWTGAILFGTREPLPSRILPPLEQTPDNPATDPFLNERISCVNVDLWGWFQYHSAYYRPYKALFCSLFVPIDGIKAQLDAAYAKLKLNANTVVAIHLRRGDFGKGYFFVTPADWYLSWLDVIWGTLDTPILFIASDEPETARADFARYKPITASEIVVETSLAPYYPDFYFMSQCDVLAIANSSFSFAAAMLNLKAHTFVRPDLSLKRLVAFDPWDSDVILRSDTVESQTEDVYRGNYMTFSSANNLHPLKTPLQKKMPLPIKYLAVYKKGIMLISTPYVEHDKKHGVIPLQKIFCGPQCTTTGTLRGLTSIRTQSQIYDIAIPLVELPQMLMPDIFVAHITPENLPCNLSALICPKIAIIGREILESHSTEDIVRYFSKESYDVLTIDTTIIDPRLLELQVIDDDRSILSIASCGTYYEKGPYRLISIAEIEHITCILIGERMVSLGLIEQAFSHFMTIFERCSVPRIRSLAAYHIGRMSLTYLNDAECAKIMLKQATDILCNC